jgi:hypothetical protein
MREYTHPRGEEDGNKMEGKLVSKETIVTDGV